MTVTPTIPPRVDYELTPTGHSLLEPAKEMARWALMHREDFEQARKRFAERTEISNAGHPRRARHGRNA